MKTVINVPVIWTQSKSIYSQYKKFLPVIFFFGGFIWDSLTLTRIDNFLDNLILLAYLLGLWILIIISTLVQREKLTWPPLVRFKQWMPMGMQFFLGGLFSAYVVFYFQSATWSASALFLILLGALLVANEFLESKLSNLYLQISLYFLVSFSFFIFFIPMILKRVDYFAFWVGGLCSIVLIAAMLAAFHRFKAFSERKELIVLVVVVLTLFAGMHLFYLKNWIPPVPFSLKYKGMYHQVKRQKDQYVLEHVKPRWYQPGKSADKIFIDQYGTKAYCFISVFAPTELKGRIIHQWQRYNLKKEKWQTTDRLAYVMTGGRKHGYRGYTFKKHLSPGRWRVEIRTKKDQLLGRCYFKVKFSNTIKNKRSARKKILFSKITI